MGKWVSISVAAALVGAGCVAAPAAAANASTGHVDVYVSGSTHTASFGSKASCAPHAATVAKQVADHAKSGVKLVPFLSAANNSYNRADSLTCFPVASGRWTYLIAYVAPTGHKLNAADVLIPTSQSSWTGNVTIDLAHYYKIEHYVTKPASSWSLAACRATFASTLKKVRSSSTAAAQVVSPCRAQGTDIWFEVDYLRPKPAGMFGEPPQSIVIAEPGHLLADWYYDWSVTGHDA